MTVGRLLLALLGHVLRGRVGHRAYLVLDGGLPDAVQDQLDAADWTISEINVPRTDRFLVPVAKPHRAEVTAWAGR